MQSEPVEDASAEYVVGAGSYHARLDLKSERALYEFLWTKAVLASDFLPVVTLCLGSISSYFLYSCRISHE